MTQTLVLTSAPDQLDKTQWLRGAEPSITVERPYDPAPLMEKLRERGTKPSFRFAAFGDTHHSPAFQSVIRMARGLNLDFAVTLGDLVNLGGGREAQQNYSKLEREAGEFLRSMPVWAALGNHDIDSRWDNDIWNGIANFKAFYNLEPNYSFQFQNAKFIVLSWMLPDDAELAWCERELRASCHPFVFVVHHYPLFAFGKEEQSAALRERELALHGLLARYRATAMLSGHVHNYYRGVRDGVTYLVSAGAGVNTHEVSRRLHVNDSWYARESNGTYLLRRPGLAEKRWPAMQNFFLVFDVGQTHTRVEVHSTSGEVWEAFNLDCRMS